MAKDCSRRITLVGINEHTGNDPVAVECLTIGEMRVRLTSIGGCVILVTDSIAFGLREDRKN